MIVSNDNYRQHNCRAIKCRPMKCRYTSLPCSWDDFCNSSLGGEG